MSNNRNCTGVSDGELPADEIIARLSEVFSSVVLCAEDDAAAMYMAHGIALSLAISAGLHGTMAELVEAGADIAIMRHILLH